MVSIDRTGLRRSGSLPGTLPKTGEISSMHGRWTNERLVGNPLRATESCCYDVTSCFDVFPMSTQRNVCRRGHGLGFLVSEHSDVNSNERNRRDISKLYSRPSVSWSSGWQCADCACVCATRLSDYGHLATTGYLIFFASFEEFESSGLRSSMSRLLYKIACLRHMRTHF